MGQEITQSSFSDEDFARFDARLAEETQLLGEQLVAGHFDDAPPVAGYELEAWLVDKNADPAPRNVEYLKLLNDPEVVPELSTFNVELNGAAETLTGHAISSLYKALVARWDRCQEAASTLELQLIATGILPTIARSDLSVTNMSEMKRYQALNAQVLRLREGRPINLNIEGIESLAFLHEDVMLEAATTSFQIHLQVDAANAHRYYNAAKIASAPVVAASVNSPYLFGKHLWEETRIPLFEQSVSVGGSDYSRRVTFGVRYAEETIFEIFEANRDRYPVMLPMVSDEPPEAFSHLRLHNGTIWRWNRPLVGFGADGKPHVRIEHRVVPAGPSHIDEFANAAFFFGLTQALASQDERPERKLPFERCSKNFYSAARSGLGAPVIWIDGTKAEIGELCTEVAIPLAEQGLAMLGVDAEELDYWMDVVRSRVSSGRTGAAWQRRWVERYGPDWHNLVIAYAENQQSGLPVHRWNW